MVMRHRLPLEGEFDVQISLSEMLAPGLSIAVARPLVYLGTKFEALSNRGDGNLIGDTDLEDIVTVMAYGEEVPELGVMAPCEWWVFLARGPKAKHTMCHIFDYRRRRVEELVTH